MKKYSFFFVLFFLIFSCKKEPQFLHKIEGKRIQINDSIAKNTNIEAFIKPYRENVNKSMDEPLSFAPINMHKKDGEFETTVGNLMADVIYEQAQPIFNKRTGKNIDFVLVNHGGIRSPINEGIITRRTAYKLMPFENSIVVTELSEEKMRDLLTYLTKAKRAHPISQGKVVLNKDYSINSFKLTNGRELKKGQTYFVATNDYLQNGGDYMTFFKDPVSLHVLDYKIRNALIDYFTKKDTVPARHDQRFVRLNK